ncbi:MAG: hypothetical protein IKP20_00085 [Candidatus Methanomethylophilaceae archaeon]|nr:hypothetical protein [Candidatus Methanomethylophilaceae archaeon]
MMPMVQTQKVKTGKSGLGVLLIVAGIVVLIALVIYALTRPGIFESVVTIALYVVIALAVLAVIAYAAMMIMAVPMYMSKGDVVQTDVDYSLDDVKPVENSSSDDPKN